MREDEATPLLPPRSQRRAKARHQRDINGLLRYRRRKERGNNRHSSDEDGDEDRDEDGDEDGEEGGDGSSESGEDACERSPVRASLVAGRPLGATARWPRWAGLRPKSAAGRRLGLRLGLGPPSPIREAQGPPVDAPRGRVAAYCAGEQVALFKLLRWLDRLARAPPAAVVTAGHAPPLQVSGWDSKMYMGVVHSSSRCAAAGEAAQPLRQKHAFYFANGCCVFWGLSRDEERRHLQALAPFATGAGAVAAARVQAEEMAYAFGESSRVASDAVVLGSNAVAEKLAVSFAMAQSAKLDVFEARVDDRIRKTKHVPSGLASVGAIRYSHADISRLIGQLFIELADVNLHSDILDEPDFFWEDDEFEPLYKRTLKFLGVAKRVKVLNKRLDILRELVQVLNQELTQQHGAKLEWIVIWLLLIEIVISVGWNVLLKDILGLFRH